MNLYNELMEFLEANNWLSLEDKDNASGVVKTYLKVYKPKLKQQKMKCKHKWSDPLEHRADIYTGVERYKQCLICGEIREVKPTETIEDEM